MTQTLRQAWGIILAGFLIAGFVLTPIVVRAAEFKAGEQSSFPFGETVRDDLYMVGSTVSSAGTVFGDGMFAGGNVLVSGPIGGDIAAAGGTVTILADVGGDLRIAGGTVILQSRVNEDVLIGGGQVTVAGPGINGEVVVAGGQITITAPIAGDAKIRGGDIIIDSTISGDVDVRADKVTLGEHAVIGGTFTYSAPEEVTLAEGAVVHGETAYTKVESRTGAKPEKRDIAKAFLALITVALFAKFLMLLVGALLLGYFFRRFTTETIMRTLAKPLGQLGRGVVVFIVLPVASIILLVTIIGLPLGALGLISFAALMIVTNFVAAIATGSVVHTWIWKPNEIQVNWKTILLGAVIYSILGIIPLIGWVVKFTILLMVLGAMCSIKSEILKSWR